MTPLKNLDLFSGVGGLSLGLEKTGGFITTGFCEIDAYASKVLKQWWPDVPNEQRGIIALNALLKRALTSSRRASLVRTYPLLAEAPDLPAPVRDSSGLCFEPFAWFDQKARCWKTWQRCLVEGWQTFSGTWPRSGMTRNGIAYQRQPLVRLTSATEFGSLFPTPEASNTKAVALRSAGRSPKSYIDWPTPHGFSQNGRSNGPSGNELGRAVNRSLFPTPRTTGLDGGSNSRKAAKARGTWPTPMARDYKGQGMSRERKLTREPDNLPSAVQATDGSGSLNPTWVEWLMGFPPGWTDCGASATPSSRKSPK